MKDLQELLSEVQNTCHKCATSGVHRFCLQRGCPLADVSHRIAKGLWSVDGESYSNLTDELLSLYRPAVALVCIHARVTGGMLNVTELKLLTALLRTAYLLGREDERISLAVERMWRDEDTGD